MCPIDAPLRETGAKLPRALFDKMVSAKNYQSACIWCGSSSSRCSICTCTTTSTGGEQDGACAARRHSQAGRGDHTAGIQPFPEQFFAHLRRWLCRRLLQLQMGGSPLADAYSPVEETRCAGPETGTRFWNEILGVGGSRPAMESFVAFAGWREPKIDALLRHRRARRRVIKHLGRGRAGRC